MTSGSGADLAGEVEGKLVGARGIASRPLSIRCHAQAGQQRPQAELDVGGDGAVAGRS
jgi:hypothetical protein